MVASPLRLAVSIVSVGLLAGPADALTVETVVLVDQPAPGPSRCFDSLAAPLINESQVAFRSRLRDTAERPIEPGYPTFGALHVGDPPALALIVEEDSAAPGVPGATIRFPQLGGLSGAGDVAF